MKTLTKYLIEVRSGRAWRKLELFDDYDEAVESLSHAKEAGQILRLTFVTSRTSQPVHASDLITEHK